MSTFLDDPVGEVRRRADIVEVISETVVLKRSGRNYTGLCPFHNERTPSFNVNPERQIFRCFGCGEGGDVFTFVMKAQHHTFPEALKSLADRYGIQLPDRRPDDDERAQIREVNEQAAGFFQWMLAHEEWGADARAYLANRGLDVTWQKKFGLGLAPANWDGLHRFLLQQKVPIGLQEKAALVRQRPSGSGHYDYFRNRLMFPIHNEAGHVVGFGARAIAENDEPKYLNSPETVLYHKGNLLYGLNQARDAIKQRDQALLMEGYMDVITAHAHGFENAVGVLGTALTPAQARILLRYTQGKRIVIAFDADKAGQTAAERGLTTLTDVTQGVGLEARVLAVPEGKDPDAYLRKEGAESFAQLVETAPPLFQFLVERAISPFDAKTAEGRTQAISAVVPVLRTIGNYVTREEYEKRVCKILGIREESLRLEISRGMGHNVTPSRRGPVSVKKLNSREAERLLLYFMVEQPAVREAVQNKLAEMSFEPIHQEIRQSIDTLAGTRDKVTWADLIDQFGGREDAQQAISALTFADYDLWVLDDVIPVIDDCINTLLLNYWQDQVKELSRRLNDEKDLDAESVVLLTNRLTEMITYCVSLKHKRSNLLTPTKSEE